MWIRMWNEKHYLNTSAVPFRMESGVFGGLAGKCLCVLGLVMALCGVAHGAMGDVVTPERVPQAVHQRLDIYRALGVDVLGFVEGPGNLVGVIVRFPEAVSKRIPGLQIFASPGDSAVLFLTPDGKQMVIGFAFDLEKGSELVGTLAGRYDGSQRNDHPRLEGLPEEKIDVRYVETGRSSDVGRFYCFIDVRCPHSRKQFEEMKKADVLTRWVPITLGDPVSTTKASYLLALEKPSVEDLEKAMAPASMAEAAWMFTEEEKKALAFGVLELEKNVSFAVEHGVRSTPVCALVQKGKVTRTFRGFFDAAFMRGN